MAAPQAIATDTPINPHVTAPMGEEAKAATTPIPTATPQAVPQSPPSKVSIWLSVNFIIF